MTELADARISARFGARPTRPARYVLLLALATVVVPASATLRCGDDLIERGFTFFEVVERCGPPDLEYAWDQHYVPGVQARVTEWVYELGSNRFRRVLTFEEGRLRTIELRPKPEAALDTLER